VSEIPSSEPEIEILSSSAEPEEDFKAGEEKKAAPAAVSADSEEWSKKYEELKEKLVWMAADFDNYKKRTLKEREEDRKFSEAKLLKEFLVVVDNLERAMVSLPADDVDKGLLSLKQGVEMTLRQFKSLLEQHGVTKVKTVGEKFDPRFHEVMFQEATDKFPEDTVMEELQSGYLLHERVLRPALVKVAKKA
jgi:molecular chaperone GrpE